MSSDLGRILRLLQHPQGHPGYVLGAPTSSDLALFPETSVSPSSESTLLVGHMPSAQVRGEGVPRASLKAAVRVPDPQLSLGVSVVG